MKNMSTPEKHIEADYFKRSADAKIKGQDFTFCI